MVAGVLRNYLSFRDRNVKDSNRRRWPVAAWWSAFLGHVEALRLAVSKQPPMLLRMRSWLERQVVPTLAVLYTHANVLEPGKGGKRLMADLVKRGRGAYVLGILRRLRPNCCGFRWRVRRLARLGFKEVRDDLGDGFLVCHSVGGGIRFELGRLGSGAGFAA